MKNIFTEHPHRVGENYLEHLRIALYMGGLMVIGGLACIVHAFLPFCFEQTGSNILLRLMKVFIERMPKDEERLKQLSQWIQHKNNDTQ